MRLSGWLLSQSPCLKLDHHSSVQYLLDFHTEFYGATHGVSYGTSDHTLLVGTVLQVVNKNYWYGNPPYSVRSDQASSTSRTSIVPINCNHLPSHWLVISRMSEHLFSLSEGVQ